MGKYCKIQVSVDINIIKFKFLKHNKNYYKMCGENFNMKKILNSWNNFKKLLKY